jgi:Caspase domain
MIQRTLTTIGAVLLLIWSSSAFAAGVLHAPGGGAVRALVIGIDRYPNLNDKRQLAGAVADARDISRAPTAADAKVQTLTNGDAIRSRVVAEMNRLVDESKSGDLAVITYSGHGMRVRAYPGWKGLDASPFDSQIALLRFGGESIENGHEIIVDREMLAWYARLDAMFPFYASQSPHVTTDRWSYLPAVDAPFGTNLHRGYRHQPAGR